MTSRQKILISRIIISAFFFVLGLTLPVEEHVRALFYFVACAVSGYDIFLSAVSNIFRGRLLDERFLMSAATIGAFVLGEFGEGAAVMLFYQIGEWFQSFATERSRKSISALMDISPEYANIEKDGEIIKVPPEDLHPGEIFIVKAGEKIPLDGTVVHGSSLLDTSALTGESVPRECSEGTCVFSGCVNLNGVIKVRADKEYSDSTVSRILDLVENASEKKAKTERFVTRFARYYTPVIVIASVLIALLPPVLLFLFGRASGTAAVLTASDFSPWVYRALTFLVISCPCALVLSVPLSFFGGIGGSSGCGILIKGSGCLEALAKADTVVFDKTGTLTKGKLRVSGVYPSSDDKTDILMVAAHAEAYSDHPISSAIKEAYGAAISPERISGAVETAGFGISALFDGKKVFVGNSALMRANGITPTEDTPAASCVHVAVDGKYAGFISVEDEIRSEARVAVDELRKMGIGKTVLLTGDSEGSGKKTGNALGIDEIYTELLPDGKVEKLEALLKKEKDSGTLVYVGDGINDAPVLARADVGIAMGALGSDAAIEAADAVLMADNIALVPVALKIARKTVGIARQNIIFSLAVKCAVLLLGIFGYVSMWAAVFADVGVSVIAVMNAMRAMRVKKLILSVNDSYSAVQTTPEKQ